MKHPERVEDYLDHILEAIDRATRYLQPLRTADALRQNTQVQDAVARNLEIIGEAANKICKTAPEFVMLHPEIPWIEMRGMRNKMIHDYFDIDWQVVSSTIKEDLPQLRSQVERLLEHLRS